MRPRRLVLLLAVALLAPVGAAPVAVAQTELVDDGSTVEEVVSDAEGDVGEVVESTDPVEETVSDLEDAVDDTASDLEDEVDDTVDEVDETLDDTVDDLLDDPAEDDDPDPSPDPSATTDDEPSPSPSPSPSPTQSEGGADEPDTGPVEETTGEGGGTTGRADGEPSPPGSDSAGGTGSLDVATTDDAVTDDRPPEVTGPHEDDGGTSRARRTLTLVAGALLLMSIAGHMGFRAMAGGWGRR